MLNTEIFKNTINLIAIRVRNSNTLQVLKSKQIKPNLVDILKVPTVVKLDDENRLILLNKTEKNDLSKEFLDFIQDQGLELEQHQLDLDYGNYNAEYVLKKLLPEELTKDGLQTSFTQTGHLAHFNFKPEYSDYKQLIAQVIIDKNPAIKTVVNKLDTIDNEFRVFPMELLAGVDDYIVTTKELNSLFTFDFKKVYWNSRLSHEHERLVNSFKEPQIVADVMAGVGPFAIPSAKNNVRFLANDLNPESFKWLNLNIKSNKIDRFVRSFNLDGREFIRKAPYLLLDEPFQETIPSLTQKQQKELKHANKSPELLPVRNYIDHFIMNLPASALEFLDAFKPTYKAIQEKYSDTDRPLSFTRPMVHVHCFSKAADMEQATVDICQVS